DHPYQTVRLAVASLVAKAVFYPRIGLRMIGDRVEAEMRPSLGGFVDRVVQRLDATLPPLLVEKTATTTSSGEEEDGGSMAAVKSALFDADSPEGVRLHNFLETVAHWAFSGLINQYLTDASVFMRLLPYVSPFRVWFLVEFQ